ncbi:hypothetical protein CRE_13657 [Caenorhabditis remanei]|uniref:Uncharacterized protein n=1 Tax=Caenorhabditis remanei TaxID=31234 RepID=E3N7I3_CAERE|nr:hypothetical protein CRE_13657 [Caenorhabditis remanei]
MRLLSELSERVDRGERRREARGGPLWPKTEFFGVDPSPEINKDLYEVKLGGNYFQVAVSGKGGMQKSYIFRKEYRDETTMHIGADLLLRRHASTTKSRLLGMDPEGMNSHTWI